MEKKLKPCPFCGNDAILLKQVYGYSVTCSKCSASIKPFYETEEIAVKIWNQRDEPKMETYC